jgi:hypothetical protein
MFPCVPNLENIVNWGDKIFAFSRKQKCFPLNAETHFVFQSVIFVGDTMFLAFFIFSWNTLAKMDVTTTQSDLVRPGPEL